MKFVLRVLIIMKGDLQDDNTRKKIQKLSALLALN